MGSGAAVGMIGGNGFVGSSSSSWFQIKNRKKKNNLGRDRVKVMCAGSSVMDPYKTLRIQPGASESEVRKAFRQLALQVGSVFSFLFPIFLVLFAFFY